MRKYLILASLTPWQMNDPLWRIHLLTDLAFNPNRMFNFNYNTNDPFLGAYQNLGDIRPLPDVPASIGRQVWNFAQAPSGSGGTIQEASGAYTGNPTVMGGVPAQEYINRQTVLQIIEFGS